MIFGGGCAETKTGFCSSSDSFVITKVRDDVEYHFLYNNLSLCYSDIPNGVKRAICNITITQEKTFLQKMLFHIVTRSIFSQIKKLNFVYCWCFDMFYYPTFLIHQNFRMDLTCMWVQFKLKHFVLNHQKNGWRRRNTFLGFCDSNETLIFMSKSRMEAFLEIN